MEQFVQQRITFGNGSHKNFNPQLVHENWLPFPTRYIEEASAVDYKKKKLKKIIRDIKRNLRNRVVILVTKNIFIH